MTLVEISEVLHIKYGNDITFSVCTTKKKGKWPNKILSYTIVASFKIFQKLGEHQHWLAHQCSPCEHMKCEVKHNGDMGMRHLCIIMGGAFRVWLWLKWVWQLWQSKLLLCLGICSKCWSSVDYPFWSSHDHRFRSPWTPDKWPTT